MDKMFCLLELRYVCILMYLTQITWIITNHIILPFCHFDVLPFCRFAILPFCQFYLVLPFWILPTILESNLGKTKTINGQNVLPFKIEICLHLYYIIKFKISCKLLINILANFKDFLFNY